MKERLLAQLTVPGGETINDPTGFSSISLETIIGYFLTISIIIGAIGALIYLIIGGLRWIGSGGDAEDLTKARQTIIFALVGLGTIVIAGFVMKFVGDILGIPIFDFNPSGGGGGGSENF